MRQFFVTAMMAIFFASGILQADPKLEKIFAQNCIKCHGPQKQKGKLRLDRPLGQIFSDRKLLENIAAVIEAEEMPPEEAPQPTAEVRAEALQIIQKKLLLNALIIPLSDSLEPNIRIQCMIFLAWTLISLGYFPLIMWSTDLTSLASLISCHLIR